MIHASKQLDFLCPLAPMVGTQHRNQRCEIVIKIWFDRFLSLQTLRQLVFLHKTQLKVETQVPANRMCEDFVAENISKHPKSNQAASQSNRIESSRDTDTVPIRHALWATALGILCKL